MRALLVVNPKATTTTPRTREVLARAIGSELKLEVSETERRGHAAELARQAVSDGLDLVISLGGDGTVNEIVNGLLATGVREGLPALAVLPGGNANVFGRSLGLPADPVEATGEMLLALRDGRRRHVGLGRADGRWFTFCAGLGLDAEVVRAVEARRLAGTRASTLLYVRTALHQFFRETDRRHPALTLTMRGRDPVAGVYAAIVSNTAPWTYLGRRPVDPMPEASFDRGLDAIALRRLGTLSVARIVRAMLDPERAADGRSVLRLHDEPEFALRAIRPVAMQIDGEYVGEREFVRFVAVPNALSVVA